MSDNKKTTMHVSQEPKKDGCCDSSHAKDQKAQVITAGEAHLSDHHKHENVPKSDGGSGCCGGSKATK